MAPRNKTLGPNNNLTIMMELCCRRRRQRLGLSLLCGVILSRLQPGSHAFCLSSLRRPGRTYGGNRRSATAVVRKRSDDFGEPSLFKSIEDLEALTVVRLKEELKTRGLKQSGKKADLIRLLASAPGVLTPIPPPTPPSAPGVVLSDEEVARWMEEDTVLPPSPRSASQQPPSTKMRRKGGPVRPPAVMVEEVLSGISAASRFSSSRPGSAAAKELIEDAELAEAAPTRAPRGHQMASRGADGNNTRPGGGLPPRATDSAGFPTTTAPQGQLSEPTEDMRKRAIIMDLLERQETTFEVEKGLEPAKVPRNDVYIVSTKKALRPWDGPHADRAETHLVMLLTDVFGYKDPFTRSTADEIAEVCDAIVVVPDMFRKRPWTHEMPEEEKEAWRSSHDPGVVANDIRACADYARNQYKPTSLGLVGFCYGGGRALEEAAAGVVKPDNVVVFYPTRYDVSEVASKVACPVAAFFAEHDVLPGATIADAYTLRETLLDNDKVSDFQVKLCPGAGHGFVHRPMKDDKDNAEDAMLLATSWLDMYLQKHFPAVPGGVKKSGFEFWELPARSGVL